MAASTRGTISRWTGETLIASSACSSSRIVRAPRSAQIAVPPAPAISSATISGLACWTTASTLAPPVNDSAPSCLVSDPTCSAITAPNGIDTRADGRIVTLAMNQNCSISSRTWNGRRKVSPMTLAPSANSLPIWRSAPAPGCRRLAAIVTPASPSRVQATLVVQAWRDLGPGLVGQGVHDVQHPLGPALYSLPGGQPRAWPQLRHDPDRLALHPQARCRSCCSAGVIRSPPGPAWSFSSCMPIGPWMRPLTNWVITGSSLVSSISLGPNMTRPALNSMPRLSGTVLAIWMSCVTIRIVASSSALRSMSSCDR